MVTEGADVIGCRTLGAATEKDAGDRAGKNQVPDLRDNRDGGKTRVDVGGEPACPLTLFDRESEPLEESGRQRANSRLGVCRFPVDQLPSEENRQMRIGGEYRDLAFDDGRNDCFWR
jgi:hypothetical protein